MREAVSQGEGLAAKTVKGSAYSIGASAVTMVMGFGRSVLMARLLQPEHFGIVAFALTFLNFTRPLRDFGLDEALIHRKPDKEMSLEDALAVHFTLRLILTGLFVLLLVGAIPVLRTFYPERPFLVPVLLALTLGEVAIALGATPSTYLRKEMRFRELAVLQMLTSLSMTVIGPLMAWQGYGVWAIVGERLSGLILATFAVLALIRPWKPTWSFSWHTVKWYLHYGKFVSASRGLGKVITEFDDFWIGTVLGSQPLGFYSRAYEFANYPRRVVSDPIVQVLFPAFAKAQDDRLRLSKAFFRTFSLVARLGFLVAGVLALAAPLFIPLLIGEQWLPMIVTFQLMIVYTVLDPLLSVSSNLVTAAGHPEFTTRAKLFQGLFFIPAVVGATYWGGVNGVAIAADVMLLLGLVSLLVQSTRLVDFSLLRMLGPPLLALSAGGLTSVGMMILGLDDGLLPGIGKILAFVLIYSCVLLILERDQYPGQLRAVLGVVARSDTWSGS